MAKNKKPSLARGNRGNEEIYDRQLGGTRCLDHDAVTLPIVGARSLSAIVDARLLPSYTTLDYNAKNGTFKERRVQSDAEETILSSAQDAQMRLSHRMRTGQDRKYDSTVPTMGCAAPPTKTKRGY